MNNKNAQLQMVDKVPYKAKSNLNPSCIDMLSICVEPLDTDAVGVDLVLVRRRGLRHVAELHRYDDRRL